MNRGWVWGCKSDRKSKKIVKVGGRNGRYVKGSKERGAWKTGRERERERERGGGER